MTCGVSVMKSAIRLYFSDLFGVSKDTIGKQEAKQGDRDLSGGLLDNKGRGDRNIPRQARKKSNNGISYRSEARRDSPGFAFTGKI